MRSTLLLTLLFAALALAKPYNSYMDIPISSSYNNEDTPQLENFFRHRHRRTHRPRPTTEQSITTSVVVKEVTGNSEVVTLGAGNGVSDGNDVIVVTSKPDSRAHRTLGNKVAQGLPEQSSDGPILIHGAGVTDNSEIHVTREDLHRHHHRRRTAHPLPTGKASTADVKEATVNADNVTPAAEIVVSHDAAVLLTGEPDSKAHRTLRSRFTRKPSTSEPDARAHRTGWVGRFTRRPSTAEPEARAHRTRAAVTGLAPVITAESGIPAAHDSAWFKGHVTIAA